MRPLVCPGHVQLRPAAGASAAPATTPWSEILYLRPPIKGDFQAFLCTATGYGRVGVKDGKPFCEVVSGQIPFSKIAYAAP